MDSYRLLQLIDIFKVTPNFQLYGQTGRVFLNKKHIPSMFKNNNNVNVDNLLEYTTEPYFIPEDTSLLSQLIIFKKEKKRIGCVVNEYGCLLYTSDAADE